MYTTRSIDLPDPKQLDIEPKFWFRDESGKAHPVELEYLLPQNRLLMGETYSDEGVWGKKVQSNDYMRLPYFPGDIYFNDKAVFSKYPGDKDLLIANVSAGLNGATLVGIGGENIAPRVNATHSEFIYEGKTYLAKSISDGSGYAITADGRRGLGASSQMVRLYKSTSDPEEMLTLAELDPENPANLRLLGCLATLLVAKAVNDIGKNLKKNKPNPLLLGKMRNVTIDLVGAKRWTAGPF